MGQQANERKTSMALTERDELWIKDMIEASQNRAALATRKVIFEEAIPGHERNCRHWLTIKVALMCLGGVVTFLGVGNIWGFSALISAVNEVRASTSISAASAHTDARTAHNDVEKPKDK